MILRRYFINGVLVIVFYKINIVYTDNVRNRIYSFNGVVCFFWGFLDFIIELRVVWNIDGIEFIGVYGLYYF